MKSLILLLFSLVSLFYVAHVLPRASVGAPVSNAQFLQMSFDERQAWYRGAFDAIGHLAYQSDKEQAACIWRWLDEKRVIRTDFLLEHFQEHPDKNPTTTILILLKNDCHLPV